MKKLSEVQQDVIAAMSSGWELGVSKAFVGRCWLQKGGCGKGGETKSVKVSTVSALRKAGLIEIAGSSLTAEKYRLRSNAI